MSKIKTVLIDKNPGRNAQTYGIARELNTNLEYIHNPSVGVVGNGGDSQCYLGVKHKVDIIDELLLSVDVIPNSIVLAQAANESGWGSSRFAKEYNALFGEYTYNHEKGVVPYDREEGKKHLVKYFSSIDQSVISYFNNINSHYAYDQFRQLRKAQRNNNNSFDAFSLVGKLGFYAEDVDYIKTINSIIKTNNLLQFDNIKSITNL